MLTGVLQLLLWLSGAPWKQCRKLAESPIYIGLQQLRNHIIWVYLHLLFLQAIDRHLCISESRRGVLPSFEKTASKSTSCLGKYIYIYITCMRCGHQAFAWKETFFPTCQVRVSRYLQRFNSFFLPSFTFITFSSTSSTSSYQFRMQGRAPGPEPHRELRMQWRAPAHKRREKARYNVRIDAR